MKRNAMGDVLTERDFQDAARFDMKRFGLTMDEALKLVRTGDYLDNLLKIDRWREQHGFPAQNSALTRGYIYQLVGLPKRRGRRG